MCRRVITHFMHHDVQVPMVLDSVSPGATVYANPLRTQFHRCELQVPPMQLSIPSCIYSAKPMGKCPYHTCCIPYMYVKFCRHFVENVHEKDMEYDSEPEECEAFVLEHHHERLVECSYQEKTPATWRELRKIRWDKANWLPAFAHERRFQPSWEEKFFAECEKLYALERDTSILYAAMLDLIQSNPPCPWSTEQAARGHVLKVEGELHTQRKLVFDLFKWATECGSCDRTAY